MLRSNQLSYATVTRDGIISFRGGCRASLFSSEKGLVGVAACLWAGSSQICGKMDTAVPASGPRVADERLIRLTASAGAKVRALAVREAQGNFLRVAISGGGCNGLSYKMRFVGEAKPADILVRSEGVEVLVDPKSALYLRGTQLDYSDKMIGGGFKFSNPNAKASCSCGESFSL
jgi:iron-sulfur cluster assembly protein